jgi:twitching motility protein PilT
MQTFDQHLLEHLAAGRVTMEDAVRVASSPHDFKLMVAAQARIAPRAHPDRQRAEASPVAPPAEPVAPPAPPVASEPVAPAAPVAPPAVAGPPPGGSAPPPGVLS